SRVKQLAYMGKKQTYRLTTASGKKIRTTANHPYLVAPKLAPNRVAIFIDGANVEASMRYMNARIDYEKLYQSFDGDKGVSFAGFYQAYFRTEGQERFFGRLKHLGYSLITKPLKIIKQNGENDLPKANFDVEIACDACLTHTDYDTAVLLSGDSDFTYLAEQLQKYGKKVIVIAPYRATGRELRTQSDIFLNIATMPFTTFSIGNDAGNNRKDPRRGHHTRLSPALPILSQVHTLVKGGVWRKVSELKEGQMIATTGANGKSIYERIISIEPVAEEDVYDVEIEGTHNFIGNGIVAHNTAFVVNQGAPAGSLYIAPSGNVGIGTTSPSQLLSVHGNGLFSGNLSA
ncbi:MAG: NYN domain-containing protein, partial [Patescibacteria group bacterium]